MVDQQSSYSFSRSRLRFNSLDPILPVSMRSATPAGVGLVGGLGGAGLSGAGRIGSGDNGFCGSWDSADFLRSALTAPVGLFPVDSPLIAAPSILWRARSRA
jgi:hypothetical protein